jgi:hypothetical protein
MGSRRHKTIGGKKIAGPDKARRSFADHGDRQSPSRGEQLTATGCKDRPHSGRNAQPIAISNIQYDERIRCDQRAEPHDCHAGHRCDKARGRAIVA